MTSPINSKRLRASIDALGAIGAFDAGGGITGVNRQALTDADAKGRRLVMSWFEEAGLEVTVDPIGNVYGRRAGAENQLDPVIIGSHIDSVPSAGRFDGCLGVLGGLEVIRTLNDLGETTRRPLTIAFFTDEEGCRFGTDMLGSAVATGRIPLQKALAKTDRNGVSLSTELDRLGFRGDAPLSKSAHAYVECHIEQGPVLAAGGFDLGVVMGVQAISWFEATLTGNAAHAGTTPMHHRRDPSVVAARINLEMRAMAKDGKYGDKMLTTMGVLLPEPGTINVIPGRLRCTFDLRNPDDKMMAAAEEALVKFAHDAAAAEGVKLECERVAGTPRVSFDEGVRGIIAGHADAMGLKNTAILSGAGHDAQEWSRVCKTAMIFVPGEHDGVSHNPREFSTPEQCAHGIGVLYETARSLAAEASIP